MRRILPLILKSLLTVVFSSPIVVAADFRAGAAIVDITPTELPVLVNGSMVSRTVGEIKTPLSARAVALADGNERLVIVVVDSCMMGRELLDDAKALASSQTGLPTDRMLISATHTHSAPSSMACLGTEADPAYVPFLRVKLAEAVAAALDNLEPAEVGFGSIDAAEYTALRRWIRRPDRIADDPFGNPTVRANMHSARNPDDVTGESGPEDPELSLISLRSRDGRPIAVLANFSMHYYGDQNLSADYFGLFCGGLEQQLTVDRDSGKPPFVGIMSHGCSGDIWRRDYTKSESEWDAGQKTIQQYTDGLVYLAVKALRDIEHRHDVDLAMSERRMTLKYRVPDVQRVEWARRIVNELGDQLPKTQTEVYAKEQLILHERRQTEIVVQAIRIGDIGIATTPNETYAITGLKIKAASPLRQTMVIELANGGDGYIPPPEQHLFGGYNTWAARSAGLEVTAEPKITAACIELLESVSGKLRRDTTLSRGLASDMLVNAEPLAYWRLNEASGPLAADASGRSLHAFYESGITWYLPGPHTTAFCKRPDVNRAPMFAGGRLRTMLPQLLDRYSVSLWLWNGMPNDARGVTGWFFSRGPDWGLGTEGDHFGIGGRDGHTGRLIFLHGNDSETIVAGKTEIPRWTWQHVVITRFDNRVTCYLNGDPEFETESPSGSDASLTNIFFGGRSDNESNWEGRLDEIAVFDRLLTVEEIRDLAVRFDQP